VLVGSANDRRTLDKACVHRAKTLIAIIGDDGANVETAVLAHQLNQKRTSGTLECVVHVFDPAASAGVETTSHFHRHHRPLRPAVLQRLRDRRPGDAPQCPAISSKGAAGRHTSSSWLGPAGGIAAGASGGWVASRPESRGQAMRHVVDRDANRKKDWILLFYPELEETCRITFVEMDVRFPRFPGRVLPEGGDDLPPVTAAYVCVDNDSLALSAALALHEFLGGRRVPIAVRMTEQAGLAALLRSDAESPGLIEGVHAVGLLDVVCSLDLVLGKPSPAAAQSKTQAS